jgi:protein-S-isoprenylcysteine O-methyltransferase Ste14
MVTESVLRAAFWVLLGGLWVMRVYFMRRVRQAGERPTRDRKAIEREGRGLFVGRTAVLFFFGAILVLYAYDSPWLSTLSISLPDSLRWAGLALGLVGLGLWTWTQAVLGKEWSPQLRLREQHRLVTGGPYLWMRHPMYTSMFGVGIALALLAANWCFVLFAVAMTAGFVVRAPREERMMLETFGEEYRVYMQRTGRFFPKLWLCARPDIGFRTWPGHFIGPAERTPGDQGIKEEK